MHESNFAAVSMALTERILNRCLGAIAPNRQS
jgi:hypothetical protein